MPVVVTFIIGRSQFLSISRAESDGGAEAAAKKKQDEAAKKREVFEQREKERIAAQEEKEKKRQAHMANDPNVTGKAGLVVEFGADFDFVGTGLVGTAAAATKGEPIDGKAGSRASRCAGCRPAQTAVFHVTLAPIRLEFQSDDSDADLEAGAVTACSRHCDARR